MHASQQCVRRLLNLLVITFLLLVNSAANANVVQAKAPAVYQNPLALRTADNKRVESCADPAVIQGNTPGDNAWYLYCTTDPLRGDDRDRSGNLIFHLIPMYKSTDLVNWSYQGDVFATRPAWVAGDAGLWAPDIEFFNGKYYLYFTASNTSQKGGGSAIGVVTSSSPTGPWSDSAIVVEPHAPPCCPTDKRWVFDPAIVTDDTTGQRYIFYGSYFGGISARKLFADGLSSDPASQVQITIANRYEGAYIRKHGGYYYLFASATNCCNGPLTGYSVFAGRSQSPLGPFVDREGVSLLAGRVGGTPVISMNGNRWVGPGHNAIVTDWAGQDWFVYHAVDSNDPYFAGAVGFTKRPVLLDRLDWIDGWPTVRAERWASDSPQRAPVTQSGGNNGVGPGNNQLGSGSAGKEAKPLAQFSDEFNASALSAQWRWVRQPTAGAYGLENGTFRFDTQAADLYVDSNNASVLLEAAPKQDYLVEARVKLNLPPEGCCYNYVQAGLVIYKDDDNFIKLAHASIWETRQTEYAKELSPVPNGYPRYGNTVVGAPDEWTYLRIVRHAQGKTERYTAYTSRNGITWVHGGTWTHQLGDQAKIGLVSMGGTGFTANFDYVRVYRVQGQANGPDGWDAEADAPEN
ncbi:MAG: family 43 glycosylhydrolase [Caldilineaceae bacterium]